MEARTLKIVAIDDNKDNLTALEAVVRDALPGCVLLTALNGPRGIEVARTEDPDVILLDIVMPGMDGFEVCRQLKADERLHLIPVIFLTALRTDRESRINALEAGADGFVSKPFDEVELTAQIRAMVKIKTGNQHQRMEKDELARLVAERTRALQTSHIATLNLMEDLKAENEARKKSEERYRILFDRANDGIFILSVDGKLVSVNESFARMHGYSVKEMLPMKLKDLDTPESYQLAPERTRRLLAGEALTFEVAHYHKDGHTFPLEVSASLIAFGGETFIQCFHRDVTERKALEGQLNQARKMEAVGQLAGGVAHDFNNILQIILGNVELAGDQTAPADPIRADLEQIKSAGQRAADLTRQLLAFARKQTITPRTLDLNEVVESMLKMMRRLIGENIELGWAPRANLWPVMMDPSQVDQIMANLCINARDAIDGVGALHIATENVRVDELLAMRHEEFLPGDYVLLTVSDTGCGMDKETQGKIFEPFFTTKAVGKGTGLGLATVYGIVRQNKGHIGVYSETGKGTTFCIHLPRHMAACAVHCAESPAQPVARGCETVLLVEDDITILKMGDRMLRKLGYAVLASGTPEAALRMAAEHAGEIQLLVTDIVMPGMNGRELAGRLKARHPDLKCLFMSGFTADVIACQGVLDKDINFIQKPFSMAGLATKVREVLAGS